MRRDKWIEMRGRAAICTRVRETAYVRRRKIDGPSDPLATYLAYLRPSIFPPSAYLSTPVCAQWIDELYR